MNLAKCGKCGWVHFEVTREYAEHEVDQFNKYYLKLSEEAKQEYYNNRTSNLSDYEKCYRCGSTYKDFIDSIDTDSLNGVTLQPIIKRNQ